LPKGGLIFVKQLGVTGSSTYSHDATVGVMCCGQAEVKDGQGIYQLNMELGEK
jgi:hypothetical protein